MKNRTVLPALNLRPNLDLSTSVLHIGSTSGLKSRPNLGMGTSVPYINFLTTFFIYNKNNIKTLLNLFIDKIVKKTSITMTLKKEIEKICIIIKDLT